VSNHQQQAERLMIEISEHQYHGNSEQYIRFLNGFRPHGVHFSIDQFGINSTAFGFLQGLKLEQLKIDGSYINKLHQDRDNQFFLRSLTDIAHNLEIKIVANFVEDEAELKSVLALDMDGAQGYHIGKPELQG
jgi:EAL domain-containing protein (putative c-di-GMP-specific phosphodiesterase class I)